MAAPLAGASIPPGASPVDNGGRPCEEREGADMQLTLYVRSHCHLCAEMHREVLALARRNAFSIQVVDIDTDADLVARYGHKVPVLVGENEEICHYFLDEQALAEYLSRPQ